MRRMVWVVLVAGCQVDEGEVCIQAGGEQATCPAAEEVDPDDAFTTGGDCDAKVTRIIERLNARPELPIGSDGFGTRCCYVAKLRDTTPFSECTLLTDAL